MNTIPIRVGDVFSINEPITFRDRSFIGKEKTITISKGDMFLVRKVGIQDPNKGLEDARPEPCAEIVLVKSKEAALMNYDHINFIVKNDKGVVVKNILK